MFFPVPYSSHQSVCVVHDSNGGMGSLSSTVAQVLQKGPFCPGSINCALIRLSFSGFKKSIEKRAVSTHVPWVPIKVPFMVTVDSITIVSFFIMANVLLSMLLVLKSELVSEAICHE